MNDPLQGVAERTGKKIKYQIGASLLAAAGFLLFREPMVGVAAVCGGMIAVVMALMLAHDVKKATACANTDPKKSMIILYVGAAIRFVLVIALFALGLGLLNLDPLATFVGFGIAQLVNVIVARS